MVDELTGKCGDILDLGLEAHLEWLTRRDALIAKDWIVITY